jgi:hypothetical protein
MVSNFGRFIRKRLYWYKNKNGVGDYKLVKILYVKCKEGLL